VKFGLYCVIFRALVAKLWFAYWVASDGVVLISMVLSFGDEI